VRAAAAVLLSVGALLGLTTARLVIDGRTHFREGERRAREGDRERAILEFEEAARSYVPGSPYPRRALERIGLIAKAHEMRGDMPQALRAWESIRRSVLSTRHVVQPNRDLLEGAERELRRLREARRGRAGSAAMDPAARPEDPSPIVAILLFVGLLLWIGSAISLLVGPRPAEAERQLSVARLVSWVTCAGGLALWLAMAWIAG